MLVRLSKPYFAIVAASVTSFAAVGESAANPPAPSSLPDPVLAGKPLAGESPGTVRKHDGGCFGYHPSGAITKVDCPTVLEKEPSGEAVYREAESGECVLIAPWEGEPKSIPCPAVLVPAGAASTGTSAKVAPSASSSVAPVDTTSKVAQPKVVPPSSDRSCGKCAATRSNDGENVSGAAVTLVVLATVTSRSRRSAERRARRSKAPR